MNFDPVRNPSDDLAVAQGCYFDHNGGEKVCAFVERFCRQSKGRWSGQPIKLIPWQRDLIMRGFGWRKANGRRRFKTIHCEIPKKNGKSTLISSLAIELAIQDGENAAEIYLNAVDRKQADIVFEEACRMVEASPQLTDRLNISRYHGTITDPKRYGVIQKNSGDAPSKDGANASGVIFDEIHRFGINREMWDIYTYSGIAREQPIKIIITTAGDEAEGVWWELREHSQEVNMGLRPDTTHLGVIYRANTDADFGGADDLDDPETWKKVNPSMGFTMSLEDFRADYQTARTKGGAEWANFLRLRLGIVMRSEGKFLQITEWDACGGWEQLDLSTSCFMGLDLSSRDDLTALVILTGNAEDGFSAQARFWLPSERIAELEDRHGQPYRVWAEEGFIRLIPGPVILNEYIEREIVEIAAARNLKGLFIDPWNGLDLANRLLNVHGLPVEFIRQGYASLNDPTKRLKDLILARMIRHGGNPILRWHAMNCVEVKDAAGNVKLDKKASRKKIDGMAALVNALAAAIARGDADSSSSVYESRGLLTV